MSKTTKSSNQPKKSDGPNATRPVGPGEQLPLPLTGSGPHLGPAPVSSAPVPLGTKNFSSRRPHRREPATELMKVVAKKVPVKKRIERDFSPAEADEIRQALHAQAEADQEQAKTDEERAAAQAIREKIIDIKKRAKAMERDNRSKVILFPSYSRHKETTEWYKLGDFSALYYVYRMSDRMGRSATIHKDTDKFAKMHSIAAVRGIESFLKKAMDLNEFERYEQTLDGIYILYLKNPLDEDEIGILRRTDEERKNTMHSVLRPRNADPAIYQNILMVVRQVLPRTGKMERGYFTTIGETIARDILKITYTYFLFAKGYIKKEEMKTQILCRIEELKSGVALLGEIGVWGFDVSTSIGANINTLEKSVTNMK